MLTSWERIEPVDVISHQEEVLVLLDGHCLRLSELSSHLYLYLSEPREFMELAAELELEFGPAPGGTPRAVKAVLHRLAELGLVRQRA